MESGNRASGFVVQPRLKFKHLRDQMLFQYLMSTANYNDSDLLKIGETILNVSELTRELGWSRKEIYVSLERLESDGLITRNTWKNNRGIKVSILQYDEFQDLKIYQNKGQRNEKRGQQTQNKGQRRGNEKPNAPTVEGEEKNDKGQRIEKRGQRNEMKGQLVTITAFINSINNINKTLKEYIAEAPVKNKNLSTTEEIETFVDFATRTNALPVGVSKKILVSYFDCIRLTRQTCTISANILVNFIEKIRKYSANQINYSLWKHVEQHDDKRETYTLGILRNTKEPEARRGLIKLKNKGGGLGHAVGSEHSEYDYGF